MANRLENVFGEDNNQRFDNQNKNMLDMFMDNNGMDKAYSSQEKLIKLFNMQELGAVIKALNNKTSTEQDGISNRILKHMTFIAKEKVLVLFNKCLSHYEIPEYWKNSKVTALMKLSQSRTHQNF